MWKRMLLSVGLLPALSLPVFAGEDAGGTSGHESARHTSGRVDARLAKETTKPVAVRELDASRLFGGSRVSKKVFLGKAPNHRAALCEGRTCDDPEVIRDEKTLAEIVENKSIRDRIAGQVDFTREKLVLFAWTGRSGERMSAKVRGTGDDSSVIFYELPIVGDGFVKTHHVHLYVIGKDVKWSLEPAPEEGVR